MAKPLKVTLLAPYPPPYGGISVHVQRLKKRLDGMGVDCTVYAYSGGSGKENGVIPIRSRGGWLLSRLWHPSDGVLHCHGYSPMALVALALLSFLGRKKIIMTTHGFLFEKMKVPLWDRIVFKIASKTNIYFIVESAVLRERIMSLGIKPKNINRENILAFIPPSVSQEDIAQIPKHIWNFIKSHSPIIVSNAYRVAFYNGEDLYGIDMCVELCGELKRDYPNVGFVFCLPDIGDSRYLREMERRIAKKKLRSNFLFVTRPMPFYPILMKSDVFVRPTNVDSYGVSVAEAIYLGKPAVASDVCSRAEGTVLFRSRDMGDFAQKVREVLGNYREYKRKLRRIRFEDNVAKVVGIYKTVIGAKKG